MTLPTRDQLVKRRGVQITLQEITLIALNAYRRRCVPPVQPLAESTIRNLYYAQNSFEIEIDIERITSGRLAARMGLLAAAARNLEGYVKLPADNIGCLCERLERDDVSIRVIQYFSVVKDRIFTRVGVCGYGLPTREQIATRNRETRAFFSAPAVTA